MTVLSTIAFVVASLCLLRLVTDFIRGNPPTYGAFALMAIIGMWLATTMDDATLAGASGLFAGWNLALAWSQHTSSVRVFRVWRDEQLLDGLLAPEGATAA